MFASLKGCRHDPEQFCPACYNDLDQRIAKLEQERFGVSFSPQNTSVRPTWFPPVRNTAPAPVITFVLRDTSPKRRTPAAAKKAQNRPRKIPVLKPKQKPKKEPTQKAKKAKQDPGKKAVKTLIPLAQTKKKWKKDTNPKAQKRPPKVKKVKFAKVKPEYDAKGLVYE